MNSLLQMKDLRLIEEEWLVLGHPLLSGRSRIRKRGSMSLTPKHMAFLLFWLTEYKEAERDPSLSSRKKVE